MVIKALLVLMIIYIIISVCIASLSSVHQKNYIGAFKASTSAGIPDILVNCDENEILSVQEDDNHVDWADSFFATDCGPEGKNIFSIYADSKMKNCRAIVTETGAKFEDPDCL